MSSRYPSEASARGPVALTAAALALTCASSCLPEAPAGAVTRQIGAIVYDTDSRREFFEVARDDVRQLVAQSLVAIVPRAALNAAGDGLAADVPSLAAGTRLCPSQPHAAQPAAAFCSGVLVDWDLVLTAGHCARAFAPQSAVALFGYHYAEPGRLAFRAGDAHAFAGIVGEALEPDGRRPRHDHAFLRLARPVRPPHRPVPVRIRPLLVGQPVAFAGTSGGVPMKVDLEGLVATDGEPWQDYFWHASTPFRARRVVGPSTRTSRSPV